MTEPGASPVQRGEPAPAVVRVHAVHDGVVLERGGAFARARRDFTFDALFVSDDPVTAAIAAFAQGSAASTPDLTRLRAPLGSQEVWAAGVTYLRSRTARMAESEHTGGGDFYDRVYDAERPELFFKSSPHRVAAPGTPLRLRRDSRWTVPEPELTLAISAHGRIFGYTIGNDMSSRDIEGENPLYLPQAKVYHRNAALGPCLVVSRRLPGPATAISMEIRRHGACVFAGETTVGRIKRPLGSLVGWLCREDRFPSGCYLMTGTGIVPPDAFTLQQGDEVFIAIEGVGTLVNTIEG